MEDFIKAVTDVVTEYGWQTVVIAVASLLLIELIKPIIQKSVKNEKVRHLIYQGIQFVFIIATTYAIYALHEHAWINPLDIWAKASAGFVVLNVIYPLFSNIQLQAVFEKGRDFVYANIGKIMACIFTKKTDKKQVKATTTTDNEKPNESGETNKESVIVLE